MARRCCTYHISVVQDTAHDHVFLGASGDDDGGANKSPSRHDIKNSAATVACRDERTDVESHREADENQTWLLDMGHSARPTVHQTEKVRRNRVLTRRRAPLPELLYEPVHSLRR